MDSETFRLSNGLRIVFRQDLSIHTIHCGFLINAGSRDESQSEHGLAHLIEHCLFKGTANRKPFHILSRLDSVGGEINAYTTKEETCVYASAMKEHFDRAAELLFDIVFASQFPDKEVAKELNVVKDEINSYRENPDEMLLDEFEEKLFPANSLGRNILGTSESLDQMDRTSILNFVDRLYSTDQIVFSCVGNISRKRFMNFCQKYLESIPLRKRINDKRVAPTPEVFHLDKKESVHQSHTIVGGPAMGMTDDRVNAMMLLNNVLGGPALNSILNLNIREKLGYCYYIESNYNPYSDLGLFEIYFGTDPKYHKRILKLVRKELNKLKERPLSSRALSLAKKQLVGQIALAREHRSSLMIAMAKSLLFYNEVESFQEIHDKIQAISERDLLNVSQEVFDEGNLSSLAYHPKG
jgi:predicted Zn-dependent peptidase